MAITKMEIPPLMTQNERGHTLVRQMGPSPGGTMPIHIPRLMPYLSKSGKVIKMVVTNGTAMFINAGDCRIQPPSTIKTQNFISPRFESNATWKRVTDEPKKYPIPAGTQVNCNFTSMCILNPTFNAN